MSRAMKSVKLSGRQQGSFYSTAIIVILFGVFLTVALKIAPAYMDNSVIKNAMEGIDANNDLAQMPLAEIRTSIMRTLNTNNVEFDASNITLVEEGGSEYIDIVYERRIPLFSNISALVSFEQRYEKR